MPQLHVARNTIFDLLSNKKANFLIPDYQRPYAWDEDKCQTLWDDIFVFSFPDNNCDDFDDGEEYFLGCIVTYKEEEMGVSEVIDGQQRLTTLMLLLRAFYDRFKKMTDPKSKGIRERIEKCIWKTDGFGEVDINNLKIDSDVATGDDKKEFLDILRNGAVKDDNKSQYAVNYNFFVKQVKKFSDEQPSYYAYFPVRILDNCIVLPIEADAQDTALRIFSTLNDRGLPLSDADIFKAQFYKHFGDHGQRKKFIESWKKLEEATSQIFDSNAGMDDLFTRYMYYLRAKEERNKSTTTKSLRNFYEGKDRKYNYLKQDKTLDNLKTLTSFWESIHHQEEIFSDNILKKLFVLKYAPNSMWQYITSVYFLQNRKEDGSLEETAFGKFLDKITAFIFASAIVNPGVAALRTPIYEEMINIIDGKSVTFSRHKFVETEARSRFETHNFTNQRPVTRSMITWCAFTFPNQEILEIDEEFDIEHIYPKKRHEMQTALKNEDNLESLGNKVLLEKSINVQASDYRFEDKKKIYVGEMRRGKNKEPSKISEIMENIIHYEDFQESTIESRKKDILDEFFDFLREEELLTNDEISTSEESSASGDLLTVGSN